MIDREVIGRLLFMGCLARCYMAFPDSFHSVIGQTKYTKWSTRVNHKIPIKYGWTTHLKFDWLYSSLAAHGLIVKHGWCVSPTKDRHPWGLSTSISSCHISDTFLQRVLAFHCTVSNCICDIPCSCIVLYSVDICALVNVSVQIDTFYIFVTIFYISATLHAWI